MPQHEIVVIGASAGGLHALSVILTELPQSLRACVLVVVHTRSEGAGIPPDLLARVSLAVRGIRQGPRAAS